VALNREGHRPATQILLVVLVIIREGQLKGTGLLGGDPLQRLGETGHRLALRIAEHHAPAHVLEERLLSQIGNLRVCFVPFPGNQDAVDFQPHLVTHSRGTFFGLNLSLAVLHHP